LRIVIPTICFASAFRFEIKGSGRIEVTLPR